MGFRLTHAHSAGMASPKKSDLVLLNSRQNGLKKLHVRGNGPICDTTSLRQWPEFTRFTYEDSFCSEKSLVKIVAFVPTRVTEIVKS